MELGDNVPLALGRTGGQDCFCAPGSSIMVEETVILKGLHDFDEKRTFWLLSMKGMGSFRSLLTNSATFLGILAKDVENTCFGTCLHDCFGT